MLDLDCDNSLWITWERQPRNISTSRLLGVPLVEYVYEKNGVSRYLKSIIKTIVLVLRRRPKYVFCQNPSVVLAVLIVAISKILRVKSIVDAHNIALEQGSSSTNVLKLLNKLSIKYADLVIVTNSGLVSIVESMGGRAIILPDPLPSYPDKLASSNDNELSRYKAFCITSWGDDEPISDLIEAAASLKANVDFYFSGNYKKFDKNLMVYCPSNVHLLGFVSEKQYLDELFSCDFAIDLTTRDNCLVCGGYESIAAGKPVLLSDTAAQREYFGQAAVYCDINSKSIEQSIKHMIDNLDSLSDIVANFKYAAISREKDRKEIVIEAVSALR